jgi:lipoprotein NlpI
MEQAIIFSRSEISALAARDDLARLEAERVVARREGLLDVRAYTADLEAEVEYQRGLYVAAAVSEIATLRAELFGAQEG